MGQALLPHNEIHRHLRMQGRRIEKRYGDIRRLDDQGEVGRSQNDALCSPLSEFINLLKHIFLGLGLEDTDTQLFLKNSMEFLPSSSGFGYKRFDSVVFLQPIRDESVFHRIKSSD